MRKIITALVAAFVMFAAAPAAADAAYLSKARAAKKATQTARLMYRQIDEATDYGRTRARDCRRRSRAVVDCLFAVYFEDEVGDEIECTDVVRVKRTRFGRVTTKFLPTEPVCEYV